ncbi:CU044_5270 family protein [Dactylosporangium sp. NPDC048998]|uniref:CU044_5270 family protein n=1 Tax=Dactylosporangium sp. NPDC048998 TaxID=3363976 RepID=UPI003723BBB0
MDEFEMLSAARPVDPPSPEKVAAARSALLRLVRQEPVSVEEPGALREVPQLGPLPAQKPSGSRLPAVEAPSWRRRLHARVTLPAAAAALALAAAIVVSAHRPAPHSPGGPAADGSPKVSGSARDLLLIAADKTLTEPASGQGQYWVSEVEEGTLLQVGEPGNEYAIMGRTSTTTWYSMTPSTSTWRAYNWAGAAPASAADRDAWQRAGSPTSWPIGQGPGCPPDPDKQYTAEAAAEEITRKEPGEARFNVVGVSLTAAQIRRLPSETDALRAWLKTTITQQGLPHGTDAELGKSIFAAAVNLLFDTPVAPPVRAAVYRVLADLTSVRTLGAVTDARGRSGIAVVIETNNTPAEQAADSGGPTQVSIVFDPQSGRALAFETRVLRPADYLAWVPAGALFEYRLLLDSHWTDEPPAATGAVAQSEGRRIVC